MGFFSNKKIKQPKLADATDFLNPADMKAMSGEKNQETVVQGNNDEVKKEKKAEKKRLKKEKKLAKQKTKELKRAKKEDVKQSKPEPVKQAFVKEVNKENGKNKKNENRKKKVKKEKKAPEPQKSIDRMDLANPKILEINLIKDQISVFFDWYKNLALLIIFAFLSFLLIGEIYLALAWWQDRSQGQVEYSSNNFITLNQEIRDIKDKADEALAFKGKLSQVNYLLDNHIYWSNLFDYLEGVTMDEVKYSNFSGDISGVYTLQATAESFPDVGRQVQKFLVDEYTVSAKVDSGEAQMGDDDIIGDVDFNIQLELNPEVFNK